MKINELLTEVHWTDIYPKNFQVFRKKYLKLLREKKAYNLFVQFSNYADNTLNRVAYNGDKVNHSDMVGIYSYPIEYVLTHPSDVWYGSGARYMRILEDHSKNSLYLSDINTENKVERTLNNMGFNYKEIMNSIAIAKKVFKRRNTGTNKFAKLFLSCVQMDLLSPPIDDGKTPTYETRTGADQTKLLRNAGYDAIVDTSKTNKLAIINDREPEQTVFLTRNAFRVIEVIDLRGGIPEKDLSGMVTNNPDTTSITRPFASKLAEVMDGDKIKEWAGDAKIRKNMDASYRYYWTVKGRRISIDFERPNSYYVNKKLGEKKHRVSKLSNEWMTKIEVKTELGDIKIHGSSDTTFDEMVSVMQSNWNRLKENPHQTDWTPQDSKSFISVINKQKDEFYAKQREEDRKKKLMDFDKFSEDVQKLATYYNMPFTPPTDDFSKEQLVGVMQFLSNAYRQNKKPIEQLVTQWYESVKTWTKIGSWTDPKFYQAALERQHQIMTAVHQLGPIVIRGSEDCDPLYWLRFGSDMFQFLNRELQEKQSEITEDWNIDAYHGTGSDIKAFSLHKLGYGAGSRESPIGFWFTNNPAAAGQFADWSAKGNGANIIPVKLRLKNPLVVDDYDEIRDLVDKFTEFSRNGYMIHGRNIRMMQDKVDYNGIRKWLKLHGYDGIVLKNTLVDSPDGKTKIDQYVVLNPNQIRSKFAKLDPTKKDSENIVDEGV